MVFDFQGIYIYTWTFQFGCLTWNHGSVTTGVKSPSLRIVLGSNWHPLEGAGTRYYGGASYFEGDRLNNGNM